MWLAPDWEHVGWKVNPEAPWQRTRLGFDTTDHVLDAVICPDLCTWEWEDEDERAEAVERGLYSAKDAEQIRNRALRLVRRLLGAERAKAKAWAAWCPPQPGQLPTLLPGWDDM
jgi:hypothetical protein